jgi:putative endonuclease
LDSERRYYVYIMASRSRNLYAGVTGDLCRRALEHKRGEIEGFTKRYNIHRLVYFETFKYIDNAIAREKQVKAWTRAKRLALIDGMNPTWQDLAKGWGERIELQIPRFARDHNPSQKNGSPNSPSKSLDPTQKGLTEFTGNLTLKD